MNLVTGAAGHLGNVLVRELLARGQPVRALILPGEDTLALQGLDCEMVRGNVLDPASLNQAMQGVDVVYHMAALVSIVEDHAPLLYKVNVQGTRNVISAAHQAGVRRLVYTSSIHALTRPPDGVTIDETLPFDPQNPAGSYDRTKAEASLAVQQAAQFGLDAVIVCPTGVLGPYDFRRSEMGEMVLSWMKRGIGIVVNGFFDFVDVRDVAAGHILAAERGRTGETYILGGERISVTRIHHLVQQAAQLRAPAVNIPLPLAMFSARFAEIYYRLTNTRPRFTRYSLETLVSNSQISSAKANNSLGYRARSLADTLADTVAWWMENQKLVKSSVRITP
jgi:dihydroflavonol-4-reductase